MGDPRDDFIAIQLSIENKDKSSKCLIRGVTLTEFDRILNYKMAYSGSNFEGGEVVTCNLSILNSPKPVFVRNFNKATISDILVEAFKSETKSAFDITIPLSKLKSKKALHIGRLLPISEETEFHSHLNIELTINLLKAINLNVDVGSFTFGYTL